MPLPDLNVSVTPDDMNELIQGDPVVQQKAVMVALQRMLRQEKASKLSILKQLKDGTLTLDRIVVSDNDFQIMPEPPKEPSKNNTSKEKVPA
jgi:hypothetical protein